MASAKLADANRRRHHRRRTVLAARLREFGALTDQEAAAVVGSSAPTVRSVRAEFGLPRPAPGGRRGDANRRRAALRRAELAGRLATLGALTSEEAAAVLGCSRSLVLRVRREHGLPAPRQVRVAGRWRTQRGDGS